MDNLQVRFGRMLASHRKRRGLKQADLSELAKLSVDQIAKLETGASGPSFAAIGRLATALEIDPAELFTYELGGRPAERRALTDLVADLSRLKDSDLVWVRGILKAALTPRS
jgi:transcriptional regulator with XRE-family HTH domain